MKLVRLKFLRCLNELITTHKGDVEVFTYDKISNYVRADRGGLLFYEAGSVRSSSVSILLILYFDDNDIVYDYRLDQIKY